MDTMSCDESGSGCEDVDVNMYDKAVVGELER